MPINDFITSTIITASPPLGLPSLTIPMAAAILTAPQDALWDSVYGAGDNVQSVAPDTWPAFLLSIGVTTGEDLQVALTDMFSQRVNNAQSAPDELLIGRRATAVAQVYTVTVDAFEAGNYTITIGGLAYTGVTTTDFVVPGNTDEPTTATDIRSAINGGSVPVTASGAGDDIILTADELGVPFTVSVTHSVTPANISVVLTTPNEGIGEDVAIWDLEDNRWFFLLETTRSSGVIQTAAEVIEASASPRMMVGQTDDALAQTGASTDDLASTLGSAGLGLTRTMLIWHPDDNEFVDFALVGRQAGFLPGDPGWVHVPLASVTGQSLPVLTSPTTLETKRYTSLESYLAILPPVSSTRGGQMLDGQFIDIVHGIDDLNLRIAARVYEGLRGGFAPYTGGEGTVQSQVQGALTERVGPPGRAFLVEGSITVFVPPASEQTGANALLRHYAGVTWSATAQGKVHSVDIVGFLSQGGS